MIFHQNNYEIVGYASHKHQLPNGIVYSQWFSNTHTAKVDEASITEHYIGGLLSGSLRHHTAQYRQLIQRAVWLHSHQQDTEIT
jgi:hypothetical protein